MDNRDEFTYFIESLPAGDVVFLMSKLEKKDQQNLLTMIHTKEAADVIEELPYVQLLILLKIWLPVMQPALASGPILTTIIDMVGFFLIQSLATFAISELEGL